MAFHKSPPAFPSSNRVLVVPLVDIPCLESFEFLVEPSFGLGWPQICTVVFGFESRDRVGDILFKSERMNRN